MQTGLDSVRFLMSANVGENLKPLSKVASGGELARIMLAMKQVLAHQDGVPTLIFDEVDSGIGGATAEVVGQLLKKLGESRQVLCVTHLPQVAACGDNHWQVEKTFNGEKTVSSLRVLEEAGRVEEVARMLAGISISANTRTVAQEMIKGHNK